MSMTPVDRSRGRRRHLLLLTREAIVLAAVTTLLATAAAAEDANLEASAKANAAIVARLNGLQNLVVQYKLHENDTPPLSAIPAMAAMNAAGVGNGMVMRLHSGPQDSVCTFRYLDGRYWFETRLTEESMKSTLISSFQKEIKCYNLEGFERYTLAIQPFKEMGMGTRCARPQDVQAYPDQLIDIGLGVREWDANDWMKPEALKDMIVHFTDDGSAELQRLDPEKHRAHVWDFSPRDGYALTHYSMYYGETLGVELVASDFRKVNGMALPFHIDIQQYAEEGGHRLQVRQNVMDVTEYRLKPADNTPDSYQITWPVNTAISDRKSGKSMIIRSGPQKLDDQKIEEIVRNRSEQLLRSVQAGQPPAK
jgi:hypothetical protein